MKDSDYNTGFAFDQPIMIDEDSLIFIKEFLYISIFKKVLYVSTF